MEIDKKYLSLSKQEFDTQKKLILCTYCNKIMIEPVQCKNCLNNFCLKCIQDIPNHKVSMFFSNIFTKKENICSHEKYESSNQCKKVIMSLTCICKNKCEMKIDLNFINDHYQYQCPKLGFQQKVNELNSKIKTLENDNTALKLCNDALIKQYFQEVKELNPWVTGPNSIKSKFHHHGLKSNNNQTRDWTCSICNAEHFRPQNSFYCELCDVDLCYECVIFCLFT